MGGNQVPGGRAIGMKQIGEFPAAEVASGEQSAPTGAMNGAHQAPAAEVCTGEPSACSTSPKAKVRWTALRPEVLRVHLQRWQAGQACFMRQPVCLPLYLHGVPHVKGCPKDPLDGGGGTAP